MVQHLFTEASRIRHYNKLQNNHIVFSSILQLNFVKINFVLKMSKKVGKSRTRRVWSRIETRTLLVYAIKRKDEFNHISKKKYIHRHLVEDMIHSGVADVPYTEQEIKIKLKNIKYAYKSAVDSNASTGAAAMIEPYKDLLQDLYDKETSLEASNHATIASGVLSSPMPIPVSQSTIDQEFETSRPNCALKSDASGSNFAFEDLIEVSFSEGEAIRPKQKEEKQSAKDLHRQKKLEHDQLREYNKERRHDEKMKLLRDQEAAMEKRHEDRRAWNAQLINYLKRK